MLRRKDYNEFPSINYKILKSYPNVFLLSLSYYVTAAGPFIDGLQSSTIMYETKAIMCEVDEVEKLVDFPVIL